MSSSIPKTYSGYLVEAPGLGLSSVKLIKDQQTPEPKFGQVLVAVKAVSLNYRDWAVITGTYPGIKPNLVPCSDASGEVVALGEGVSSWAVGDRVMGVFTQGQLAGAYDDANYPTTALGAGADGVLTEYKVFNEQGLVRVPEHLTWQEAATLPCAAVTAWNSLFGAKQGAPSLMPGQTVLLQGTGGVSCIGAQLALLAGAQVIVTSSSDDKLALLVDHIGATRNGGGVGPLHTINYKKFPDWDKKALEIINGKGIDFVLEVGGAGTLDKSFAALRQGGTIIDIGFLSGGPDVQLPNVAMSALFKSAIFRGVLVGSKKNFEALNSALASNGIKPIVSKVYAFDDAPQAYKDQSVSGVVGKVVIRVGA